MKRVSILAIVFLSASLTQVGVAQAGSPTNTDSSSQTRQQEKPNKGKPTQKAKAKSTKPPIKAETGKKTTTSQDNAYALAARKGNPEPPPK
jgi:hypothetical protein